MSDDVFAVRTSFQDVAELGQGYLERADGERMLLPLPVEVAKGEGVRFIVYLTDGTPAFAGAGRAVQVSDQGTEVDSEQRYETLIDGLVFDERSRPVYDYIVAVRQMAYADAGASAEADAAMGEEAVLESDEPTTHAEEANPALIAEMMRPDSVHPLEEDDLRDTKSMSPAEKAYEAASAGAAAAPTRRMEAYSEVTPPDNNVGLAMVEEERALAQSEIPRVLADPDASTQIVEARSMMPLPTGSLRRPAIAVGWQPKAPKRPESKPGSGMFRYAAGALPIPARPPHPDLPAEQRVQPAAAP